MTELPEQYGFGIASRVGSKKAAVENAIRLLRRISATLAEGLRRRPDPGFGQGVLSHPVRHVSIQAPRAAKGGGSGEVKETRWTDSVGQDFPMRFEGSDDKIKGGPGGAVVDLQRDGAGNVIAAIFKPGAAAWKATSPGPDFCQEYAFDMAPYGQPGAVLTGRFHHADTPSGGGGGAACYVQVTDPALAKQSSMVQEVNALHCEVTPACLFEKHGGALFNKASGKYLSDCHTDKGDVNALAYDRSAANVGAWFWEVAMPDGQFAFMSYYGSYLAVESARVKESVRSAMVGTTRWTDGAGHDWPQMKINGDKVTGGLENATFVMKRDRGGLVTGATCSVGAVSCGWTAEGPAGPGICGVEFSCDLAKQITGRFDAVVSESEVGSSGLGTSNS